MRGKKYDERRLFFLLFSGDYFSTDVVKLWEHRPAGDAQMNKGLIPYILGNMGVRGGARGGEGGRRHMR